MPVKASAIHPQDSVGDRETRADRKEGLWRQRRIQEEEEEERLTEPDKASCGGSSRFPDEDGQIGVGRLDGRVRRADKGAVGGLRVRTRG